MVFNKKYKHSLISFTIVLVLTGICFLLSYPSPSKLSKFMGVLIAYALILILGIIGGIATILSRVARQEKDKYSFAYNFFGTLNIILGLIGLILVTTTDSVDETFIAVIFSLVLGLLIYSDIYYSRRENSL